jgi:hypothetical protein
VDETGHAYALKLTAAGLKAIAVEEAEAVEAAAGNSTPPGVVPNEIIDHKAAAVNVAQPTAIARPREGSKLARSRTYSDARAARRSTRWPTHWLAPDTSSQ